MDLRYLILPLMLAAGGATAASCPTKEQNEQLRKACGSPASPSCVTLRTAVGKSCGGPPIALAKITGACGKGAACVNPVGHPTDPMSHPGVGQHGLKNGLPNIKAKEAGARR